MPGATIPQVAVLAAAATFGGIVTAITLRQKQTQSPPSFASPPVLDLGPNGVPRVVHSFLASPVLKYGNPGTW